MMALQMTLCAADKCTGPRCGVSHRFLAGVPSKPFHTRSRKLRFSHFLLRDVCPHTGRQSGAQSTATEVSQAESTSRSSAEPSTTLPSCVTARTLVDIVSHGTLCTIGDDEIPLGTYVTYVVDRQGLPLLRLRADAVHTANLQRDPMCSLFVQPAELPARLLGRVTLIGKVEALGEEEAREAAGKHAAAHSQAVGVDAPRESDLFFRLALDRCFFVGGMGSDSQAEVISAADYLSAQPDEMRWAAAKLVMSYNNERAEEVLRVASHARGLRLEAVEGAEMLWVDALGAYYNTLAAGQEQIVRVPFLRVVDDERDARSTLTMLAQVAWESERSYMPRLPALETTP